MITLEHVHYEIHDEVSKIDKEHNTFIKCYLVVYCDHNFISEHNIISRVSNLMIRNLD